MPTCRHCHHRDHAAADCPVPDCGCIRHEPVDLAAREARKRGWLVRVAFETRQGWTRDVEVRVRAKSMTGAAMRGVQEARKLALKPRARASATRMVIVRA